MNQFFYLNHGSISQWKSLHKERDWISPTNDAALFENQNTFWRFSTLCYGTDNMTMETAIKANVTIFFGTTILALLGAIYCYHKIFKTSEPYRKCHQRAVSSTISTNLSGNGEENVLINTNSEKTECISTGVIILSIWKMMLSVFLNFFLCLSIFPACLTSIKWQKSDTDIFGIKTADWSFIKYSVFLTFNIGDWLGKKFGGVSYSSDKENLTLLLQVVKQGAV